MAVSMLDNISYKGSKPDNVRSQFETVADMVAYSDNYLPEIYTTLVVENGKQYKYQKSNSVDPELGKWREVSSGSTDLTDYYNKTEINNFLDAKLNEVEFTPVKETVEKLDSDKDTVGSVRNLDEQVYKDSTDYTDSRIEAVNRKKSIACDKKPVYTAGETIEDDTITYEIEGESITIKADEIWFYYMDENDINADGVISANEMGLVQTIWIDRTEFSIMSFGIDMSEYVSKKTDVTNEYTGEELDASKIPNIGALQKLEKKITDLFSGSNKASKVIYENENYPEQTDVQRALDAIWSRIDYIKPSVSSFTMTPSATEYEVGQEVTSLSFAWTYNKNVTRQTLTDCTLTDENDRSAEWSGSLKTSKTFTLSCSDGQNSATASKTISFKNKIYYGSAAIPTEYDSAFILGLSNKQFATAKKGSYTMTVGGGEYGYLAFPSSFGTLATVWIGGFEVTVEHCGDISFTNASGGVVTYSIYKTGKSGLGLITMEVK